MNIAINMTPLKEGKPVTGIGNYVYNVVSRILEIDNTNEFYLISNGKLSVSIPKKNNVHLIEMNCRSSYLFSRYFVIKEIINNRIDVYWTTTQALPIIKPKALRYCMTIYDIANLKHVKYAVYRSPRQKLFKHVTRQSLKAADAVFAISESTKKDIIEEFKIKNPHKIHVIYLGHPQRKKEYWNSESSMLNDIEKPFFLYVGTLQPRKNINTIVDGFLKLRREESLSLVLAGAVGWGMDNVLKTIEETKYKSDIILTGYIDEADKHFLYKNAAGVLFPSLYEGFGLPILEAFEYGLPVITCRNTSLPEVGGDAAFYLKDELSADELAGLMKQIIHLTPEERKIIKDKDNEQLIKFDWEKCAEQTYHILIGNELSHRCS